MAVDVFMSIGNDTNNKFEFTFCNTVMSHNTHLTFTDKLLPPLRSQCLFLDTTREWHRFTKPVWVMGMGSDGYSWEYGFPYL